MLKKVLFWGITLSIPFIFLLACILGYYAYHKIKYNDKYCGSFAQIDAQAGWVLKNNASSCYGFWESSNGTRRGFSSTVFTDRNGFRAAAAGGNTAREGIMVVGDSWTFGHGVDYEQSFPAQLAGRTQTGVVAVASPGYGAAQALVLAERWVESLSPKIIIYLDIGHWQRSACTGSTRPHYILKPCYWENPNTSKAELVVPPADFVSTAAAWGVKPGGMLGAGEAGWDYFLISRPVLRVLGLLARTGLMSGMAHDFRAVAVDGLVIRQGVVDHLVRLSVRSGAPVWLLDPGDAYAAFDTQLSALPGPPVVRIGRAQWSKNVLAPASKLPEDQQRVPLDGHFGPGTNALIAAYLTRLLDETTASTSN